MDKRRVLVTGSSRGIGKACAQRLATDGFHVTVHCHRSTESARELVRDIENSGGSADFMQFDVRDRGAVKTELESAMKENGAWYGVVCNAGAHDDSAFPAMTAEQWDGVMSSNLDAFYNVLHPVVMPMIQLRQGGRIVTMASISGLVGNRGQANYSAAKAGVIGATKALALELAKRKITVNCVAPGIIETEMTSDLPKEMKEAVPMRRFGTSKEIAAAVSFLMSDDAGYLTRQVLNISGGIC